MSELFDKLMADAGIDIPRLPDGRIDLYKLKLRQEAQAAAVPTPGFKPGYPVLESLGKTAKTIATEGGKALGRGVASAVEGGAEVLEAAHNLGTYPARRLAGDENTEVFKSDITDATEAARQKFWGAHTLSPEQMDQLQMGVPQILGGAATGLGKAVHDTAASRADMYNEDIGTGEHVGNVGKALAGSLEPVASALRSTLVGDERHRDFGRDWEPIRQTQEGVINSIYRTAGKPEEEAAQDARNVSEFTVVVSRLFAEFLTPDFGVGDPALIRGFANARWGKTLSKDAWVLSDKLSDIVGSVKNALRGTKKLPMQGPRNSTSPTYG